MQRYVILSVLLLGTLAWGQSAMPGTFTQPVQSTAVMAGPLLTPPVVSLGSGLTTPTIVTGQTMFVSAPQSNFAWPSASQQRTYAGYVTPANGYVPMAAPMGISVIGPAESSLTARAAQTTGPARFDFIVAPRSTGIPGKIHGSGVGDTNLGEFAAALRKGPPPTQRTFTNDDIARLNGVTNNNFQMPGVSTQQPSYLQQHPTEQPQSHSSIGSAPIPPGVKPSPFSPKPYAYVTPNAAANGNATETAENTPPPMPGSEGNSASPASSAPNQQQSQETQPPESSAGSRRLPASSSFLPLLVLCGLGITGLGFLFAGKHW